MNIMLTHYMTCPFSVFEITTPVMFYVWTSSTMMHSKNAKKSFKDNDNRFCAHPAKNRHIFQISHIHELATAVQLVQ
jgi:hypothetical protein